AVGDAVASRGALSGIRMEAPEIVRLVAERAGEIQLKVTNASNLHKPLRIGLAVTAELNSAHEDLTTVAPPGISLVAWNCTPARRGRHGLDAIYVESPSPLGLWSKRARRPVRCELRVYPNLRNEKIEMLFLNRGTFGVHRFRQVGKGRE